MPSSPDALIQAEATLKAACLHVAADLIIARKKIESSEEPEKDMLGADVVVAKTQRFS